MAMTGGGVLPHPLATTTKSPSTTAVHPFQKSVFIKTVGSSKVNGGFARKVAHPCLDPQACTRFYAGSVSGSAVDGGHPRQVRLDEGGPVRALLHHRPIVAPHLFHAVLQHLHHLGLRAAGQQLEDG